MYYPSLVPYPYPSLVPYTYPSYVYPSMYHPSMYHQYPHDDGHYPNDGFDVSAMA